MTSPCLAGFDPKVAGSNPARAHLKLRSHARTRMAPWLRRAGDAVKSSGSYPSVPRRVRKLDPPANPADLRGTGFLHPTGNTVVDYKPDKYLGVAFPIKLRSDEPVTITRITSTDSGRRFVRPIGVRVVPFRPRSCRLCPPPHLSPEPPYRELEPMRLVTVQPQRSVAVVLHFRWVACTAAPERATATANRVLRVEYRVNGRTGAQLVPTGSARLSIRSRRCS
jgi:hypothetical protein